MGKETVKERLNERSLKATPIRIAVLEQFMKENHATSLKKIQDYLGSYDRVTFYRTIKSLEESGIIHKALEDENEVFYALCNSCTTHNHQHSHIHFKCDDCGEVSCLDANYTIELKNTNYSLDKLNIKASGSCQKCA